MCTSTRSKYVCGHKGSRKLKQCSRARKMGSPDQACGDVVEEKRNSSRYCSSCANQSLRDEFQNGEDEKDASADRRRAPPRLNERAFLDQGNREAFEYDSSSRRKSRATGLKPPRPLSERRPLSEYAPVQHVQDFDDGLNFSKPPRGSDRYHQDRDSTKPSKSNRKSVCPEKPSKSNRKSVCPEKPSKSNRKSVAYPSEQEAASGSRSRRKSIFAGLFSRDRNGRDTDGDSFVCADSRKVESKTKSDRRKSKW